MTSILDCRFNLILIANLQLMFFMVGYEKYVFFNVCYAGIIDELYAFTFKPMDNWPQKHGWDFHDLRSEYLRMGVPSDNWVLSFINENYEASCLVLLVK